MARSDGYVPVYYACINAPGLTKKTADGHDVGSYSYGNAAGARWGAALRPQKCSKCGAIVVGRTSKKRLEEEQLKERERCHEKTT